MAVRVILAAACVAAIMVPAAMARKVVTAPTTVVLWEALIMVVTDQVQVRWVVVTARRAAALTAAAWALTMAALTTVAPITVVPEWALTEAAMVPVWVTLLMAAVPWVAQITATKAATTVLLPAEAAAASTTTSINPIQRNEKPAAKAAGFFYNFFTPEPKLLVYFFRV